MVVSKKTNEILETIENFPFLNYDINSVLNTEDENLFITLEQYLVENEIEEVIVALDQSEEELIERLYQFLIEKKVNISLRSDLYKFVSGLAKINSVPGLPLIST